MSIKKLDLATPDITDGNVARIADLFPGVVTEGKDEDGKLVRVVDFDALRQELSDSIVEGPQERYRLDWPGKRAAMLAANTPITKTLRPCREESVDFDSTKNLFIEGDNLDALKLLQETYLGKVKMIYIDPPYNTGNDLVYDDNFKKESKLHELDSGEVEDDNPLTTNKDSNGRFHSDWLSMIYPRLKLAKNLLSDDGIFIASIDNNEISNLSRAVSEVFGEGNVVAIIANINNPKGRSDDKFFATAHEYLVAVAKSETALRTFGFEPEEKITRRYNKFDENNKKYREMDLRKTGDSDKRSDRPDMFYYFYYNKKNGSLEPSKQRKVNTENLIEIFPVREDGSHGRWRWGYATACLKINTVFAKLMPKRKVWTIVEKDYLEGRPPVKPTTAWTFKDVNSERGSESFISLGFDKEVFSRPKPLGTMKRIIEIGTMPKEHAIIFDLFAGSSSLAQAAFEMKVDAERNLQVVSFQFPESLREANKSQKVAHDFCIHHNIPANIAEISKERIRRAGAEILAENPDQVGKLDIGFRVLKIDSSNMNDVYYAPQELDQKNLLDTVEHIKPDRSAEDLLFQVMLDWGVDLSLPIVRETVDGKTVFFVGQNDLAACFDMKISEDLVKEMAARKPLRAVFRDDGFTSDDMKINAGQLFTQMTDGHTDMKVI